MKKNKASINIISSFNHANFVGLLKNSQDFDWKVNQVDYNQVFQTLTDSKKKIWKEKANITLIWTTPESISSEFRKLQDKNFFVARRILAKHDENYMPPKAEKGLDKNVK